MTKSRTKPRAKSGGKSRTKPRIKSGGKSWIKSGGKSGTKSIRKSGTKSWTKSIGKSKGLTNEFFCSTILSSFFILFVFDYNFFD